MSTKVRPELTVNNPYWIERHRYYELKHFTLQYLIWKKQLTYLDGLNGYSYRSAPTKSDFYRSNTETIALERLYYSDRISMIERTAKETDPVLGRFILIGVTEGISYDILKARHDVPCCKEVYYDLYRRFFWLLDKARK